MVVTHLLLGHHLRDDSHVREDIRISNVGEFFKVPFEDSSQQGLLCLLPADFPCLEH